MRSEGQNLDLYDHSPERMLERAIAQLEVAKVDPSFYGVVKNDRISFYEAEVEKWRSLVKG